MKILSSIRVFVSIAALLFISCSCQRSTHEGAGIGDRLTIDAATEDRIVKQYRAVAFVPAAHPVDVTFYVAGSSTESQACGECHEPTTMALTPRTDPEERSAHWEIELKHAAGMTCRDCHSAERPEDLHVFGDRVTFDHAYRACMVCHQSQFKDWQGGAHGKRLTGWAEPRIVGNCTACHNPHEPALPRRLTVAQPKIVPERLLQRSP